MSFREKFNYILGLIVPMVCVYFGWFTALAGWYWVLLGLTVVGLLFFDELIEFMKKTDPKRHDEFVNRTYSIKDRMILIVASIIHIGVIFVFLNSIPLLVVYAVVVIWSQYNVTQINKLARNNIK